MPLRCSHRRIPFGRTQAIAGGPEGKYAERRIDANRTSRQGERERSIPASTIGEIRSWSDHESNCRPRARCRRRPRVGARRRLFRAAGRGRPRNRTRLRGSPEPVSADRVHSPGPRASRGGLRSRRRRFLHTARSCPVVARRSIGARRSSRTVLGAGRQSPGGSATVRAAGSASRAPGPVVTSSGSPGLRPSTETGTETGTETTAALVTDRQDRPPSITAGQRGGGYGI